jgi:glycogen(starch) synthase
MGLKGFSIRKYLPNFLSSTESNLWSLPILGPSLEKIASFLWTIITSQKIKIGSVHTFGAITPSSRTISDLDFVFICRWFLSEKRSGVNLWVYSLSKSLSQMGMHVGIVCQGFSSSKNLEIDGIMIFPVFPKNLALRRTALLTDWARSSAKFVSLLEGQNRRIKGVFAPLSSIETAAFLDIPDIPTYALLVTDYALSSNKSRIKRSKRQLDLFELERRSLLTASRCIGDSESIVQDLSEALALPELSRKSQVISIAVPDKEFSFEDISKKENIVSFVGRIDYRKNLNQVLETWVSLSKLEPNLNWKLFIVANSGEDKKSEDRLRSMSGTLGITWLKNAGDQQRDSVLAKSRILLLPSEYESFGIVAVEAMQFGNAIIANKVGGLKDIIPNQAGILIDSLEPSIWAKTLQDLGTNGGRLDNMNKNAYMYGQKFSLEEQTESLREFLGFN